MQKELFYVAASRGRRSVQVITSDRELLRESVARSTARQSASELAERLAQASIRDHIEAFQLPANSRPTQPDTKARHAADLASECDEASEKGTNP